MKDRDAMKKILLVLCLIIPLMFTGCNKQEVESPINNSDENVQVFSDQVVGQVIMKDHNIAYYDNISHASFIISNENNNEVNISGVNINYYRNDILVYSITENIGTIGIKGTYAVNHLSDLNLTTCDKVTYEIIN